MADGKPSVTHYETIEAFRAATLLDIHLETGRTHQIRVHMAALRHPCVGDLTYGADPTLSARLGLTRQWLHAARLGFEHPADGRWVEFTSDYPADLAHALDRAVRAPRSSGIQASPRASGDAGTSAAPVRVETSDLEAPPQCRAQLATRSCTCTCTPSTRCSTVRPG